jgi:hypothetical protein
MLRKSMAQRYIYLPNELNLRLKQEDNVSALIVQLLNQHYQIKSIDNLSVEEIEKQIQIKKIELEAMKKIEELNNESA